MRGCNVLVIILAIPLLCEPYSTSFAQTPDEQTAAPPAPESPAPVLNADPEPVPQPPEQDEHRLTESTGQERTDAVAELSELRGAARTFPADAAARGIAEGLKAFYAKEYPQLATQKAAAIQSAAEAFAVGYQSNVFPSMKVGWGTYPNHIGHESSPGCFRCHDEAHAAPDGRTISQDCATCHSLLAMGEEDPEILHSLEQ